MLKICDNRDIKRLLDYIGDQYHRAIYLYIDLKRYGCESPDVHVYCTENESGKLNGVFLQYYDCIHCFSRDNDFVPEELDKLVSKVSPNTLFFSSDMFEHWKSRMTDLFEIHHVEMFRVSHYDEKPPIPLEAAGEADIDEIVDLLMTDEEYKKVYQRDSLIAQMKERLRQGFSRDYVLRENGRIVFHAGTVAEERPLAICGMAILEESLRGRGLGKRLFGSAYNLIVEDGLICYSNNINERARRLHLSLGYQIEAHLIKLTRIKEK